MGIDGDFEIRPAEIGDAGSLMGLHRAVLEESVYFITQPEEFRRSVYALVQMIREMSQRANCLFLVCLHGEELCGFLTVQGGFLGRMEHTGKLEVMVAHSRRGQGIGKKLMAECMQWAKASPVVEKLGLSVFATNERAVAMYRSFGFKEEGRRPREYRFEDGTYQDDILMYCFVDEDS